MGKSKSKGGNKLSEKDMDQHREYMKKYKLQSSDLDKQKMQYKDYYELLGIHRDASHTEIRKAYRKLALTCHPDRKPSPKALARWEGVPAAYAMLSNPNDRAGYDATLPTRDALVEFYRAYNPAKLNNATIETIIDGWYGREVELFEMLNSKYEVAPHQGTTKAAQHAAVMSISREKAHKIALDSQTFTSKDAANTNRTWSDVLKSAFCCKSVLSRLRSATYYEVSTTSPGFVAPHHASDTPGQAIHANMRSPVTPSHLSKPVSPNFMLPVDAENMSSATTSDGSPPSGDDCWLSTSASETYSFVQSRIEYRKEIASLRKIFIKEENVRKERLARDAEAQRQKIMKAKATRLEIKRQQQAIRAKEIAHEKAIQDEKVRKYFEEKVIIRQERVAEKERRREALVASLRQQVSKWTTAENYSEKLKEDVFIFSPHQIAARGSFDPSSTSGSAMSWLEKLQRMKPAGVHDSSDEVEASTVASAADDEDS